MQGKNEIPVDKGHIYKKMTFNYNNGFNPIWQGATPGGPALDILCSW